MIEANLLISAVVVAIVQAIKEVFPQVSGAITTIVAMVVGALVALLAAHIGVYPVSVAQGILDALFGVGTHTVASSVGTKS